MKYDEIEIKVDDNQVVITFLKDGVKVSTYYHHCDLFNGDILSVTGISGIIGDSIVTTNDL